MLSSRGQGDGVQPMVSTSESTLDTHSYLFDRQHMHETIRTPSHLILGYNSHFRLL